MRTGCWLYCATNKDLYNGEIVGYALKNEAIKDITEYFITGSRYKKAKLFIPCSVPKAVLYHEAGSMSKVSCLLLASGVNG